MKKYSIVILFTFLMLIFAIAIGKFECKETLPIYLVVENSEGREKIKPWYYEKENVFLYFVPSYSNPSKIRFVVDSTSDFFCKEYGCLVEELSEDQLAEGDYSFVCDCEEVNIKIKNLGDVSTMFISTATGSINSILADKNNKETIFFRLYAENGTKEFISSDFKIKGRGNSTWDNVEKKSFNIIADEPISFWGLQPSSKWVLLANAYDSSNMRNKLVYDFADRFGFELAPKGDFVDLFVNGEYYGLYLLCQSVETIDERVNFDEDIFLKIDLLERVKRSKCFLTEANEGLGFEVVFPKDLNDFKKSKCIQEIYDLNEKIEKEDGDWIAYFNIEEWSKKYLIDEIFSNFDAMIASSYFVMSQRNGMPYLSVNTVWDFDNSMGNRKNRHGSTINPQALYAKFETRGNSSCDKRLWYSQLYDNKEFFDEVVEKYLGEGREISEWLMDEDISSIYRKIKKSADNDCIRWNYSIPFEDEVIYISEYLEKRFQFLSSLWGEKKDYAVITFERNISGKQTYYFFVEKGKTLLDDSEFENIIDCNNTIWLNKYTGEKLDVESSIESDSTFVGSGGYYKSFVERFQEIEDILVFTCLVLMVMISFCVLLKERE